MSEFTYGLIFLNKHIAKLSAQIESLNRPYIVKELNSRWFTLIVEECEQIDTAFYNWIIRVSTTSQRL